VKLARLAIPVVVVVVVVALTTTRAQDAARPSASQVAREVDALLEAAWREAGVTPAPPADDAVLLRRLSLDVEGVIPDERTVAAVLAQRGDGDERRATWIKGLLHGQGFARSMATRWANQLVGRRAVLDSLERAPEERERTLVAWLTRQVAANTPWDDIVGELLAPTVADRGGPAEYRARYGGRVEEVTGNLLRVFQGQPLQCAQCHDHPYHEQWKQRDFWGVAAFLVREPQLTIPGTKEVVRPRFLGGEAPAPGKEGAKEPVMARELARLLTAPENPQFARATVNRVWSFFFGRAFADPDDLTQAPRLPLVLARLERDFVESGHDLRRLCEVVLSTRAYALSSTGPAATKDPALEVFARGRLRTLSPEQLWASLARATGLEEGDDEQARARRDPLRREFFRVFAGDADAAADVEQYTITQALSLLNGPITNAVLRPGPDGAPAMTRLLALPSFDEQLAAVYRRAAGRLPTRAERQALRGAARSSDEQSQLLADVLWALLNSSEFVTNH
jgi:hypothetical protein